MKGKRAIYIIWIEATFFCAGVILLKGRVIEAANIIRYMNGWDEHRVMQYCKSRKWKAEVVR